jgi:putative membrane protein
MSVLLGIAFLGAALALAQGWDLSGIALYALFPGVCAVVLGIRIINLDLTLQPVLSGVGFVLTGMGGLFAAPTLAYFRGHRLFRTLAALVLLAAAGIWALTALPAYWVHMKMAADWKPLIMRLPAGR